MDLSHANDCILKMREEIQFVATNAGDRIELAEVVVAALVAELHYLSDLQVSVEAAEAITRLNQLHSRRLLCVRIPIHNATMHRHAPLTADVRAFE